MNATLTQNKSVSLVWLVVWTAASALGLSLGVSVTLPILWNVGDPLIARIGEVPMMAVGGVLFGLGIGGGLGIAQWLVLRPRYPEARRWLVGSIIGAVVSCVLVMPLSKVANPDGGNLAVVVLLFGLIGAAIGVGQYIGARSIARHVGWIGVSLLALGLAAVPPFGPYNLEMLGLLGGSLIYGAITGVALWWFEK